MRALVASVLLVACSRDPSAAADDSTPTRSDPQIIEPTKPRPGEGQLAPGPCTRIGHAPWRCQDPDHPLAGRTDVLAAKQSISELCVLYADHRLQCYDRGKPTHVYENVDDFDFGIDLVVASGGRRGQRTFTDVLAFDALDIDGEIVEISSSGACNRIRGGVLVCEQGKLSGVSSFCEQRDYFCALIGEHVICGGTSKLNLGNADWQQKPAPIAGLPAAVQIECASAGACALTREGEVWCWGEDDASVLGRQPWDEGSWTPRPIAELHDVLGFSLAANHGCAVLANDELQCWGSVPEGLPQLGGGQRCLERSLADWQAALESAEPGAQTSKLLHELGFSRRWYAWRKQAGRPLTLEHVTIHEVELDGAAPSERVVVVRLATSNEDRVAVLAMRPNEAGRWCPLDESLSDERPIDRHPSEPWPARPDFTNPQTLSFVELTAAGRMAVELIASGGMSGELEASDYVLSYLELRDDAFVELFGPFPLYHSASGREPEPTQTGTVTLVGEFPKTIETTTTTDCRGYRGACKPGTAQRTWTFDGERYR